MALNFSEYDPTKTFDRPLPGKCHLLVAAVEEKESYYEVSCDIVAHEESSEVGKSVKVRLSKSGKGARRQQDFLIATKVISLDDIQAAIDRGETEIDPDVSEAIGQSFFSTLEEGSYTSKKTGKEVPTCDVQFDFTAVDDSHASSYPFDPELAPHLVAKKGKSDDKPASNGKAKKESKPEPAKEEAVTVPQDDSDCPF